MIALMRNYQWMKIVMFASTTAAWRRSSLALTQQLRAAGIKVLRPAAFEPGKFKNTVLGEMKRSGIRIGMAMAYDGDIQAIARGAAAEQMTLSGWAWILSDGLAAGAVGLVQGWLYMRPLLPSEGMQAFAKKVSDYTQSSFNMTVDPDSVDLAYSVALHDAIMLYAHAATKVLSEGGDVRDGLAVTQALRSMQIKGVGDRVIELNARGDRIETYEVMNYVQGSDGGMSSVAVGMYSDAEEKYTEYEQAVVWPGNTTVVPVSHSLGAFPYCGHVEFNESCAQCGMVAASPA